MKWPFTLIVRKRTQDRTRCNTETKGVKVQSYVAISCATVNHNARRFHPLMWPVISHYLGPVVFEWLEWVSGIRFTVPREFSASCLRLPRGVASSNTRCYGMLIVVEKLAHDTRALGSFDSKGSGFSFSRNRSNLFYTFIAICACDCFSTLGWTLKDPSWWNSKLTKQVIIEISIRFISYEFFKRKK